MQDLKVSFDGDAVREVVSAAILQSMDAGQRDTLIQSAIKSLMSPKPGDYRSQTPLQEAFSSACYVVAREEAQRMLAEDSAVRESIEALIRDAVVKVTTGDGREAVVGRLADAIQRGMTGER